METQKNKSSFSSQNQPSPQAKSEGCRKKFLIKNFRSEFFEELINRKYSDGEMTRSKMLAQLSKAVCCEDDRFPVANERAKLILNMIEVLSPKDFDIEDFSSKLRVFMGGKEYPYEAKLANATNSEAE
ncbi:hypothetical protein [Candidatus Endomicrobiellum devescovinae]|jgi:hypothetical protein|uniref:hypothetical protein n=1 Tax=Candidatus Endomicrobiellum devescovinae TaxID=3242322 RepID=UPI00282FAD71|nr:hypothetical protein [Endomicrobium sp.]